MECEYRLPGFKAGYLENAFVKVVVTNSTGANMYANPNVMNLMVDRLDLITQGKVVCGMSAVFTSLYC